MAVDEPVVIIRIALTVDVGTTLDELGEKSKSAEAVSGGVTADEVEDMSIAPSDCSSSISDSLSTRIFSESISSETELFIVEILSPISSINCEKNGAES